MIRFTLLTLAAIHTCWWRHEPPTPQRGIDKAIDVMCIRSDAQDRRTYVFPVWFEASFTCGDRTHFVNRTEKGEASTGSLTFYPPLDCERPATFAVVVRPMNTSRCKSTMIGPVDLRDSEFTGRLVASIHCNSAIRSAKLQALPLLPCYESMTAIAPTSAYSYRVEGCRKSIELRCTAEPFDETYPCEPTSTR